MINQPTARITAETPVGMGQATFAAEPARLTTILGSCVAVTLYSPRRRRGMLCHVVLPQSRNSGENPAKYADTAVPHMLSTLRGEGIHQSELTAKVVGGACMFGTGQSSHIGDSNVDATVHALETAGIGIAARDAGGNMGRRISFDLATGLISITSVGHPPRTI
jgi:chemotaxis protein CheD